MKRRDFITLLGGAAAWPRAARAQQPAVPVIGYLTLGAPEANARSLAAFRKGLSEAGFVEGRNVTIEFKWGQTDRDRLSEMAADLVRRRVAAIVTEGTSATLAAKAATTTIPIVFLSPGDPVQTGVVASLNRPGGNVTGITSIIVELAAKQFGLLRELLPRATRFAVLDNPNGAHYEVLVQDVRSAAQAMGRPIDVLKASTNREIDAAFTKFIELRAGALLVAPDSLFTTRRSQILTLAARHAVVAMYNGREYVEAGGLMSYGPNYAELNRQVGLYTGRVLKGEKPSDLPVMQPTKFEFVINLQTARILGIEVPATLLALADEVIE